MRSERLMCARLNCVVWVSEYLVLLSLKKKHCEDIFFNGLKKPKTVEINIA